MAGLKLFQQLHSVDMTLGSLKGDSDALASIQGSQEKLVKSLKESFAINQLLENNAPEQCTTKQSERNSDSDGKKKKLDEPAKRIRFSLIALRVASGSGNELELSAEKAY